MMFQNDYFDYKWQRNTPTVAHCFNNTSLTYQGKKERTERKGWIERQGTELYQNPYCPLTPCSLVNGLAHFGGIYRRHYINPKADSYVTTVRNSILSLYTEKTAYSEASVPTYQIARCHNVASQVRIISILKP